jgi:hypothetical protein
MYSGGTSLAMCKATLRVLYDIQNVQKESEIAYNLAMVIKNYLTSRYTDLYTVFLITIQKYLSQLVTRISYSRFGKHGKMVV